MTETNKGDDYPDGEKPNTSQDGKETKGVGAEIPFPQNGEEKKAPPAGDAGKTPTQKDPTIGVDQGHTFVEIRIPFAIGYWKTMGFIQEVMIPTVRRFHIERAQKSALKKKLISPPPGFRGFNPRNWLKK